MLARVADSLYWMARYLERAEFTARLVGLQIQRLPVATALEVATGWRLLFAGIGHDPPESESLGNMEDDDFLFVDGYTLTDILTFEKGNPAAVANCLAFARENAREVRSAIGPGIWSSINREYLDLRRTRLVEIWNREPELLYRDLAEGIQRFHGICDATMRRGSEWCFMQLGRYVERAQLVASMLVAHCGDAARREHGGEWPVLLRACNAFEAYGRECGAVFDRDAVLGLLVHEGDLPYSLRFCCRAPAGQSGCDRARSVRRARHGDRSRFSRDSTISSATERRSRGIGSPWRRATYCCSASCSGRSTMLWKGATRSALRMLDAAKRNP